MSSFPRPLCKAANKYIHQNSVPLVPAMSQSRNIVFKGMEDADKFQDESGNQLAPHNNCFEAATI